MSLNEARDILGLPPITDEYADKHFLPQYLIGSNFVTIEELNTDTIDKLRSINHPNVDESVGADDPLGGEPNNDNKK